VIETLSCESVFPFGVVSTRVSQTVTSLKSPPPAVTCLLEF
jgi:hypothetical protein